ncbi:hypothetical protein CY34DRAFT_94364, partial [Suillus luteus UH-Slu-Lm8-n1]
RSFLKLTSTYSKRLTGLLIGLRTRHLPLNQHLFRLTKVDSPDCPLTNRPRRHFSPRSIRQSKSQTEIHAR